MSKIVEGGNAKKADNNIIALSLLKKITLDDRDPTTQEQTTLAKYTGWGGIPEIFKDKEDLTQPWKERHDELKRITTPEEYDQLRASTLNAHYTTPEIAISMWSLVTRLGFKGGPVLDPSTGTGMFLGTTPSTLQIQATAVEIEPLSAQIAKNLYKDANIIIKGFQDVALHENSFNLAISNVPFGAYQIQEHSSNKTKGIDGPFSIHNYFFLKGSHAVRPGGFVAFITSHHTMDSISSSFREKVVNDFNMNLIGSIRLPNTAFNAIANTEVVADIIILQKRLEQEQINEQTKQFLETQEVVIDGTKVNVNKYYVENPQLILGKESFTGQNVYGKQYTVVDDANKSLSSQLDEAIEHFPTNIMQISTPQQIQELDNNDELDDNAPIGTTKVIFGTVKRKNLDHTYSPVRESRENINRLYEMIQIRDAIRGAYNENTKENNDNAKALLRKARESYDRFYSIYGPLHSKTNARLIAPDPDCTLLLALEKWNPETKTATKSDILTRETFQNQTIITETDNIEDALTLSLTNYKKIDFEYMSELTDVSKDDICTQLIEKRIIFLDPHEYSQNGELNYVTAEDYLSGNVRSKLKIATQACLELKNIESEKLFPHNIKELMQVCPPLLSPDQIIVNPNSPVIRTQHIKDFIEEELTGFHIRVHHAREIGYWEIGFMAHSTASATMQYGTVDYPSPKLLSAIMNGTPINVNRKIKIGGEEKTIRDEQASYLAREKSKDIITKFKSWVWEDPERTSEIVKDYNQIYNSYVPKKYIHPLQANNPNKPVFLPGSFFPHPLRPHQANAVWRIVTSSNTLLAHTVGAGKTLTIASAAMEMRRLGLRKKIMVVVPNHLLDQWATEFLKAYPTSKIIAATTTELKDRKLFTNKIATSDYDVIIIRARTFQDIPIGQEIETEYLKRRMQKLRTALHTIKESMGKQAPRRSVKMMEQKIQTYQEKIKSLQDNQTMLHGVIPFSQLGIDQLFIDEADMFKNLEYSTHSQNIRGLGSQLGSKRALDMHMKIEYIQKNGGGCVFATGTPISNSLVEAHVMQRFLQPEELKATGLEHFDEWSRLFATVTTDFELTKTGTNYRPISRFTKIQNIPELMAMLNRVWDIQTSKDLEKSNILVPGENIPIAHHRRVIVDRHPLIDSYMRHLDEREQNLSGSPQHGEDNHLVILNDGMKAAVDLRLINHQLPEYKSKITVALENIVSAYEQYNDQKLTQVVFFNRPRSFSSTDKNKITFDGVEHMIDQLKKAGIPTNEIYDLRNAKDNIKKQEIFDRFNQGSIRILFGSTLSMGVGTNIQQKLRHLHHVDVDYRPRDMEQKNGRALRVGNTCKEVDVFYYATQGSIDTGLYDLLDIKSSAIAQVMSANTDIREIEEEVFASVKQLSTENPAIKEMFQVQNELKILKTRDSSIQSTKKHATRKLSETPLEIEKIDNSINSIKSYLKDRPPQEKLNGKNFNITINEKIYSDRKKAGEKILEIASRVNKDKRDAERFGSYAGVDLSMRNGFFNNQKAILYIQIKQETFDMEILHDTPPLSVIKSIHRKTYTAPDKHMDTLEKRKKNVEINAVKLQQILNTGENNTQKIQELGERQVNLIAEVKAIQKAKAEENKFRTYSFPWFNLPDLTKEEINDAVKEYMASEGKITTLMEQKVKPQRER